MQGTNVSAIANSRSWKTFQNLISDLDAREKGEAFELLCKLYLQIDPVYASTLETVWLLKDVPLSVRTHLGLPDRDMGIDIIAKTFEGKYWAIQCKYREDKDSSLGWGEVSTFIGLSFKLCKNISFGLICHSGNRYARLLKHQDNIAFCSNEVWQGLDSDFFENAHQSLLSSKIPQIAPYKPRPHQQRAISKAKDYYGFLNTTRGKMIMPCGTGKSLTAYWIANELKAKDIVVAVPSLALMKQTLNVWLREYKASGRAQDMAWLCICSDASVVKGNRDDVFLTVGELGIPCTTKTQEISEWLHDTANVNTRIVFTTYQSSKTLAEACRLNNHIFDLGIFDEAHKTVGDMGQLFSLMLDDNNLVIKRRLFMTATEKYYSGKKDQIASMNNPLVYGETFESLTFKESISYQPPIISDYRILTLFVTKSEIKEIILKNRYVKPGGEKWDEEIEAKMLASIVALSKAMELYPITHTVSYHSSILRAKSFAKYVESYMHVSDTKKPIEAFHVSGSMSTGDRSELLESFVHSKKAVITNARCLVEGVDVPSIDCVLFADPRRSKVDIVQALGRALRPAPNKKYGYIVIPVVVDEEEDVEDFLDSEAYSDLLKTLRDLASNDERVVEYFEVAENAKVPSLHTRESSRELISMHFATNIDLNEFTRSIEINSWERLSKLSYRKYGSAKKFVHNLGLRTEKDWEYYCQGRLQGLASKPSDIPLNPAEVYKDNWEGWKSWLGGLNKAKKYVKFEIARDFVHKLELADESEWTAYMNGEYKSYHGEVWSYLPPNPEHIYFKEWQGWREWLGDDEFIMFSAARQRARLMGLKNRSEWFELVEDARRRERVNYQSKKIIAGVPNRPDFVYRSRWESWGDWLGLQPDQNSKEVIVTSAGKKKKNSQNYASFKAARSFARGLEGLVTANDWTLYTRGNYPNLPQLPDNIPKRPDKIYRKEWKSWRDWLRPRAVSDDRFLSFEFARTYARKLNLRNRGEWDKFARDEMTTKRPDNVPPNPEVFYSERWQGWIDWLVKPERSKK